MKLTFILTLMLLASSCAHYDENSKTDYTYLICDIPLQTKVSRKARWKYQTTTTVSCRQTTVR